MFCLRLILFAGLIGISAMATASDQFGWYIKPYGGLSQLSDTSGKRSDVPPQDVDVGVDAGFVAGLGVGYRYNNRWSTEVAWEYRTNDSETVFQDGTVFDDGNYASNSFYINGYYHFQSRGRWQPYVGLGVGWIQEVDIDLEGNGPELSYSDDGDVAWQAMAGVAYRWSERWSVAAEVRYLQLSDTELSGEGAAPGNLDGLDYDPVSVTISAVYRF